MKKLTIFLISFLLLFVTLAQIPSGYYTPAEGKKQNELKEALHEIISTGYVQRTYKQLWDDFKITDVRFDGYVWDIYSNCDFIFGVDQDGGFGGNSECEYYNREHSVPNSWFGGEKYPMYSDLFHLYPTDKYVNAQRADFPYGETGNTSTTYGNGSKRGVCTFPGYTGTIFEPTDEYKGDLARTYFYMVARYLDINLSQSNESQVIYTYNSTACDLTDYAVNLFLKWHRNDPVSEKETNRNNAIYGIQRNRNPYIDYPELVEHIWGNLQEVAWSTLEIEDQSTEPSIVITKQGNKICITGAAPDAEIEIYSIMGQKINADKEQECISLRQLRKGIYIIKVGDCAVKVVW
jgi:endonuclease I